MQKCTAAIRQLAYAISSDAMDEYLGMFEKIARDSLYFFYQGIILIYSRRYLRKPTLHDIRCIYKVHREKHGFPGMLGSIDCRHVERDMCHTTRRGQFHQGDHPDPTIMLEVLASQDLWFWYVFCGVAGLYNDINVIKQSPIFYDIIDRVEPAQSFYANGEQFKHGYYLADGIYNEWPTLVQAYSSPIEDKGKYFTKKQESARKDIRRAFGVLKKKVNLISRPL
ncbi:uncharacterized protein LOC143635373 [Bidens hawaiensis]|uniref:uncharacterized protein LOC143635373 n=1 Tax=Bidens hawaiensis TaxID=980011 RepID=UPI0040498DDD